MYFAQQPRKILQSSVTSNFLLVFNTASIGSAEEEIASYSLYSVIACKTKQLIVSLTWNTYNIWDKLKQKVAHKGIIIIIKTISKYILFTQVPVLVIASPAARLRWSSWRMKPALAWPPRQAVPRGRMRTGCRETPSPFGNWRRTRTQRKYWWFLGHSSRRDGTFFF